VRRRRIVDAFLAASRHGDFEGLLAVLDPEVVFRADAAAVRLGALAEIRGAPAVAETFKGRAQGAKLALVDGALALAVIMGGQLRIVLRLGFNADRIALVEAIADTEQLERVDLEIP
jgi:RNA polymerase sigma-70 factor (ECF subfamily)